MQTIDIHMSVRGAVDDALARGSGVAGLGGVGLIHTLQVPDAFLEIGYLGALFIAVATACVVLAAALTRTSDDRLWIAVGALPALILVGYLLSRSVGLPGFTSDKGEWADPPALAAMLLECTLIVLSASVLASRRVATAATDTQRAPVATIIQNPA